MKIKTSGGTLAQKNYFYINGDYTRPFVSYENVTKEILSKLKNKSFKLPVEICFIGDENKAPKHFDKYSKNDFATMIYDKKELS